jgi:endoglucanase
VTHSHSTYAVIPARRRARFPRIAVAAVLLLLTAAVLAMPAAVQRSPVLSIRVSGNHFIDQHGDPVRLLGANRSGTQYACQEGSGIFDGPSDDASIEEMQAWGMNAVRVNGNEDCWLGINGVDPQYGGAPYREALADYVRRINAHDMYVIVDLHNRDSVAAWTCVRDGGSCPGVGFTAAGMQELVDAVRATGATNPILISGPQYAGSVSRWLAFRPRDPADQLAASVHIYGKPLGSPYDDPATWGPSLAPLAAEVPVVIGEIGDTDCTHRFIDRLMPWADAHGISYLGWAWVAGDCADEPSLIADDSGTPSEYGVGLRDHLLGLAANASP